MKSIKISLIISLSLICCLLKSQDSYVGVSSGLNISKFTSPALNLTDYKMGYDFNLFYEKKIIEHFDLGIGFDYHNIGSKGGKITYKIKILNTNSQNL